MLWTLLSLLCVKYKKLWIQREYYFESGNCDVHSRSAKNVIRNPYCDLWSASGMMHAKRKYSFLWIISALVASNWSHITFFILANVLTSILNGFFPNFDQINISTTDAIFVACIFN